MINVLSCFFDERTAYVPVYRPVRTCVRNLSQLNYMYFNLLKPLRVCHSDVAVGLRSREIPSPKPKLDKDDSESSMESPIDGERAWVLGSAEKGMQPLLLECVEEWQIEAVSCNSHRKPTEAPLSPRLLWSYVDNPSRLSIFVRVTKTSWAAIGQSRLRSHRWLLYCSNAPGNLRLF